MQMKSNNIFYQLWVGLIQNYLRTHTKISNGWKFNLLITISSIFGVGFWTLLIWLKYFNVLTINPVSISLFPGTILNNVLSFFFTFVLPFFIINYLFIFRNNRYAILIEKYIEIKKKYLIIFFMTLIWGAFISFAIISLAG